MQRADELRSAIRELRGEGQGQEGGSSSGPAPTGAGAGAGAGGVRHEDKPAAAHLRAAIERKDPVAAAAAAAFAATPDGDEYEEDEEVPDEEEAPAGGIAVAGSRRSSPPARASEVEVEEPAARGLHGGGGAFGSMGQGYAYAVADGEDDYEDDYEDDAEMPSGVGAGAGRFGAGSGSDPGVLEGLGVDPRVLRAQGRDGGSAGKARGVGVGFHLDGSGGSSGAVSSASSSASSSLWRRCEDMLGAAMTKQLHAAEVATRRGEGGMSGGDLAAMLGPGRLEAREWMAQYVDLQARGK